jgi:DNA-binding NtrC family response regulator
VSCNGSAGGGTGFFTERGAYVARFERQYLTALLTRHAGDVSAAAKEAKVPRGTLYRLLKSHEIDAASFRNQRDIRQSAATGD